MTAFLSTMSEFYNHLILSGTKIYVDATTTNNSFTIT